MSERDAILFANEAFYQAFAERDMGEMEAIWSEQAPVACIHPGWHPLAGREAVLESWRAILANADSPPIRCREPRVHLRGDGEEIDRRILRPERALEQGERLRGALLLGEDLHQRSPRQ